MRKTLSIMIAILLMLLATTGCAKEADLTGNPSDKYYKDSNLQFTTWGTSSPTDGTWFVDEVTYDEGEDFRTEERYLEYYQSGLNALMLQGNDPYNGEDWESSQTKKNMDNAYAAGIKKIIVHDGRIYRLSQSEVPLVGEDKQFKTEQDLIEYLQYCMKDYKDHDGFWGVMLIDEPFWYCLPQACEVYRALKKAVEGIYVHMCLLPLDLSFNPSSDRGRFVDPADPKYDGWTLTQQYEEYLETYCKLAQPDRLLLDSYPVKESRDGSGNSSYYMLESHFMCLRIAQKVAKKYGCEFDAVGCTTELTRGSFRSDNIALKAPNKSEMYWQANAYMGFGVEYFSWYTYWAKQQNGISAHFHTDGTAFMTRKGEKTDLYYYMQQIHGEMQEFAPIILNFDYQGVRFYYKNPTSFGSAFVTNMVDNKVFNDMDKFSSFNGLELGLGQLAVVTELKDVKNNQYMYMVMNPQAPSNAIHGDVSLKATIDFGKNYKAVEIWWCGEKILRPLNKGKITLDIGAGYAAYCMPY